jgi:P27 family predicted phage terminase small subunit
MARPKKPLSLHKLQGTGRKSRIEARASELNLPAGSVGPAPEWFGEIARAEWDRLTTHEQYSQVLNPVHYGTLLHYCGLFERMVKELRGDKVTVDGVVQPATLSASERQTLNSLAMQLGITPASQGKVRMPGETKKQESPWAATKPILMSKPA